MLKNLLALSVILLAIFQGPFIYFYISGFEAIIFLVPYLFVGFFLSALLLYAIVAKRAKANKFHITALIFGITLGTISLFSEDFFEKIDWYLRKSQRDEIIEKLKIRSIKYNPEKPALHLDEFKYSLLSNGGNDILVFANAKNQFTVTFFINRGFLDHYSAFVYTNDPNEIMRLEYGIQSTAKENNFKIEKNWYRLNY